MWSHRRRWTVMVCTWLAAMGLLSGCSLLFGGGPEPTPAAAVGDEERVIMPTFTPTAEVAATATPEAQASVPTVEEVAAAPATVTTAVTATTSATSTTSTTSTAVATATATTTTTAATGTGDAAPSPGAKAIVAGEVVNTRNGPGTEYGLVGPVTRDQSFDIVAKNADASWWQICCVNGQEAWIFAELVRAENAGAVAVAQNIPAPPVAAAPQPAAPTAAPAPAEPAPPADTPAPEPPPAAAGAVNAGPCGGDDGCKFKIRGGPTKRSNGGGELKFQLFFIHSGVDGGQPQGDYRLGIEKDGQLITRFADATSIALNRNDGPMGAYNYEAKINASELPGGSVAGAYFFWVLDGNRERDSEVFRLDLAPDEGEVWIEFDQG